jgi:hypothetical protein
VVDKRRAASEAQATILPATATRINPADRTASDEIFGMKIQTLLTGTSVDPFCVRSRIIGKYIINFGEMGNRNFVGQELFYYFF